MEIPIQKSLSKYRSLGLFGVNYDSLCLDMLTKDAVSNIASMGKRALMRFYPRMQITQAPLMQKK